MGKAPAQTVQSLPGEDRKDQKHGPIPNLPSISDDNFGKVKAPPQTRSAAQQTEHRSHGITQQTEASQTGRGKAPY